MNTIASAIMSSSAMAPGTATPGAVPGATADPKSPPSFEALSSDPRGSSFVGATSLMSPVRRTPRYGPGMFNGPLVGAPHSVHGAVSPPIHEAASKRKVLKPGHQSRDPLSELPVVHAPTQPVPIAQYEAMDAYRRTGTNLPGPGSLGKKGAAGEPREILAVVGPSGTGGSQVASSFGMPHHEVAHANRGGSYVGGRVGGGRWIPRNVVSSKRRRGGSEDRQCNPSVDPRTGKRVTASQAALDHAKREIRAGLRTVDGRVIRGGRTYADAGDVPLLDPKGEGTGSAPIDIQPSARANLSPPAPAGKGQIPAADLSDLHATTQSSASQQEEVAKLRAADLEEGLRLAGQGKLLSPLIQGRRTTSGCLQLRDLQMQQASPARTVAAVAKQLPPEGSPASGQQTKEAAAKSRGSQERLYRRAAASIVSDRRAGQQDNACLVPDRHPTRPGAYPRTIEGTDQLQAQPTGGAITSDAPGAQVSPMPTDSRAPHGQTASAAQSGAATRPDEFAGLMTPQMPAPATAPTKPNTPRGKPVIGPRGKGGGGGDALWLTIGNTAARAETARQNAHTYARGLKAALDTYGSQLIRTKTSTESSRQIIKSLAAIQTSLNQLRGGRNEKNPDFAARAAASQRLVEHMATLRKHAAKADAAARVTGAARRDIGLYASGLAAELRRYHQESSQLQKETARAGNQDSETMKRRLREALRRSQNRALRQQRRVLRRNGNAAYVTEQFARTKAAKNRQISALRKAFRYRAKSADKANPEGERATARIRADYYVGVALRAGEEASSSRSWVIHNAMSRVPGYGQWVQKQRREQRQEQRKTARRNRKLDRKRRQLTEARTRLAAGRRRLQRAWEESLERPDSEAHERERAAIQATTRSLESKVTELEGEVEQISKPATASKRDPAEPGRDPDAATRGPSGQEGVAEPAQPALTPNRDDTGEPLLSSDMQDLLRQKAEKKSKFGADSKAFQELGRLLDGKIKDQAREDFLDAAANVDELATIAEGLNQALENPNLSEAERDALEEQRDAVLEDLEAQKERANAAAGFSDDPEVQNEVDELNKRADAAQPKEEDSCAVSACLEVRSACEASCIGGECECSPGSRQAGVDYVWRGEIPDGSDPDAGDSPGSGEGKGTETKKEKKKAQKKKDVAGGDGSAKANVPPDSETTIEIASPVRTTETTDGAAGDKNALKDEDQEGTDSQSSQGGTGHDGDREGDASAGGPGKEERGSYTSGKKPRTKKAKQVTVRSSTTTESRAAGFPPIGAASAGVAWTFYLLELAERTLPPNHEIRLELRRREEQTRREAERDHQRRQELWEEYLQLFEWQATAKARIQEALVHAANRDRALADVKESLSKVTTSLKEAFAEYEQASEQVWAMEQAPNARELMESSEYKDLVAKRDANQKSSQILRNLQWQLEDRKVALENDRSLEATHLRSTLTRMLDRTSGEIDRVDLEEFGASLEGRSTKEIADAIARMRWRMRWASNVALHAREAASSIAQLENEFSGFGGTIRDIFGPITGSGWRENPLAKRAYSYVDMVGDFAPGYYGANSVPDFTKDPVADIRRSYRGWSEQMVEMFRDTGEVTKQIGGRDRLAGGAFALAAAAAYGAAILSTGGLVALAKSAVKGAALGAGLDAGSQFVRINIDPRESWSWTELGKSAAIGAILAPTTGAGARIVKHLRGAAAGSSPTAIYSTVRTNFSKVVSSNRFWGQTEGAVYGMAQRNAPRWRTWMNKLGKDHGTVVFEGEAAKAFHRHEVEGLFSLFKRSLGQYKSGFGDVTWAQRHAHRVGDVLYVTQVEIGKHAGQSTLSALARLWGRRTLDFATLEGIVGGGTYLYKTEEMRREIEELEQGLEDGP